MKHVGRITNTGKRCIVVFRQIYDEHGKIVDKNSCLVVETDSLPDYVHDDLIKIVESRPSQDSGELFNVLHRTSLSNGENSLVWLVHNQRLRKFATNNIDLIPNANIKISLSKVNQIIELQSQGLSEFEISERMNEGVHEKPMAQQPYQGAISTAELNELVQKVDVMEAQTEPDREKSVREQATDLLELAKTMHNKAKELRVAAYDLAPELKK